MKYNNKSCVYGGFRYDSIKEARYAEELDWRLKAKEIEGWDRQQTFNLLVNGKKICGIRPDFIVHTKNGDEIHEVKSSITATPTWKIKWSLMQALYPEFEYMVII